MKVRFHLLPTVLLATFVVVLTGATIVFSMEKLKGLAEDNARTVFSLIAQRNADQLRTVFANADTVVEAQSRLEPQRIQQKNGEINEAVLVPALIAALRTNPYLYAVHYGFANGSLLQVVALQGSARIAKALRAPPGTAFAIRTISPASVHGPSRQEHWQFLASNEALIGSSVRDTDFVTTNRPWYTKSLDSPGLHVTDPYVYDSFPSLGLTLTRTLPNGIGVFGADLTLSNLDSYAEASLEGRDGGIVVTDDRGRVLASHSADRFDAQSPQLQEPVFRSANPMFAEAAKLLQRDGSSINTINGEEFAYASRSVAISNATTLHVVAFAPTSLYTGAIDSIRTDLWLFAALILALFLPLTYFVAHRISGSLESLAADAERIRSLDFSGEQARRSIFHEVDLLGVAQHTMKTAIRDRTKALDEVLARLESLLDNGMQLAARRSQETVMHQTLGSARHLVHAQSGQFWLYTRDGTLRLAAESHDDTVQAPTRELEISLAGAPTDPCVWALEHECPLRLSRTSLSLDMGVQRLLLGADPQSLLVVPVLARGDKPIGVFVLANALSDDPSAGFDPDLMRYVQTLAAQSGIALENSELLKAQRVLMDSMLQLIAGAIDAKSAYTGGHCARVPELARMLAEAACEVDEGPLADFRFRTEDEWREFRIGTWLHDCGKVTTPEYIVDKATKLEIIFNRIHEIRMRFEVLLRDADIERLNAVLAGGDPAACHRVFDARHAQLVDDFAFVAECNIGGEAMFPEHVARLHTIAQETWLRHFDDRLGLSQAEETRVEGRPAPPLPAIEHLLADKPQHVVPRTEQQRYDARYGFRMDVPDALYNYGEIYNLSIGRGTLTAEERYKINEHIVQTVVMLDQLPLPPELKRVPEYASTHHETLKNTGYPRKLGADELSIPARIMAIADIFEALTASDRPYKKAKSLSEAVKILSTFKTGGHIDPDLFNLFLTSGVYRRYAETFLPAGQIDGVDVEKYVAA